MASTQLQCLCILLLHLPPAPKILALITYQEMLKMWKVPSPNNRNIYPFNNIFWGIFFLFVDNFESRGQLTNFVQHFSNLSGSKFLRQNFQRSECTQGMTWRVTANEQLEAFLPIFYLFVSLVSLIVSPAPPCTVLCHMSYGVPWQCLNPSNTISL